jgi:hypothetical protein
MRWEEVFGRNAKKPVAPQQAPQSTYDALLYELRTYGLAQLNKPNCLRRLSALSSDQLNELIAALLRLRPKYPAITDELLLSTHAPQEHAALLLIISVYR